MNFLEIEESRQNAIRALHDTFMASYEPGPIILDFLVVGSLADGNWDPFTSDLDLVLVIEPIPFDVPNQREFRIATRNLVNEAYFEKASVIRMTCGVYFSNVTMLILKNPAPFAYSLKHNVFYSTIDELPYKQFFRTS